MVHLSPAAVAQIDALLDAYAAKPGHPGTLIGITNKAGERLFLRAAGTKDLGTGAAYANDTVFWVASCTKLITSVAAMQLVAAGKIGLDDDVGRVCPELASPDVVVSSTDTEITTRKATKPITLHHLLTHTAGFTYPWYNIHVRRWCGLHPDADPLRALDSPLVAEPGAKFDYGVSVDWAGVVVERVSGQSLEDYCQENIFGALGMASTSFDMASRPDLAARLATLHLWDGKETFTPYAFGDTAAWPKVVAQGTEKSGGGGLFTTGEDYLTLLSTLLNNGAHPTTGKRILPAPVVGDMFANQVADVPDQGALGDNASVATTDTGVADGALVLLPGERKGWGLGHLLNLDDIDGGRRANSGEWGGISNCFWLADRTSEIGIIVFNDILPYGVPAFIELETQVQKVVYSPGALI
ncbi:Acyltransferase LovD [Vanrija pseudolonga]|uniref:Acyltransferase LovD n=1 Tax=Vanrija pseudolonga TaxID=143232 RepID=A0AAF0Y618_9TREE|nr:Acyltransferase LovD [Vanrija pseudolonga]